jgi:ATP-dependent DNA ligase
MVSAASRAKGVAEVRLESRTAKDLTGTYPEVRAAVVGLPDRSLLLDGDDVRDRPLVDRRARLSRAIRPSAALQLTEARRDDSQRRFAQACPAGWEGLIESPLVDTRPIPRGTHWTRPELVAQVGFAEWTNDGRLRQRRFLGLRDDKRPDEVVREWSR